jgi:hypothetical protein
VHVTVVICPVCGNPETRLAAVGATWRYGDHDDPRTSQQCENFGAGVGNHNLSRRRKVNAAPYHHAYDERTRPADPDSEHRPAPAESKHTP